MADKLKVFTLGNLELYDSLIKGYVNDADAKSLKTVAIDGKKLKFYRVSEPVGDTAPAYEITLPETDISGLLAKLTGATAGNVVIANADGTIADGGTKLADLAKASDLKTVSDKVDAIEHAETGILATSQKYADNAVKVLEDGQVKTNKEAIEKLNGDASTAGSVAKAVKEASDAINNTIGTVAEGKTVVEMIADAKSDASYDDTDIKKSIEDNADAIGTLSNLETTEKGSLVGAINEVKSAVGTAETNAKVTISTEATTEGYLKTYTIKQGETEVGKIDIAKDLVVTAGEVVADPDGMEPGTYVKLTIANQEAPVYINVKDLVDAYTAKAEAAQVQVAISDTNEISATIVAGSVGTVELADKAITAVKLADDAKALFDVAGAAKALEDGQVKTNKEAIEKLETKVGEGYEAISEAEIRGLFA